MRVIRTALPLAAAALVALTITGCGSRSTGTAAAAGSPAEQAQAALTRFLGDPKIPHGNWAPTESLAGPHLRTVIPGFGIFEVDAHSYKVTEAVFEGRQMAADGGKSVTVSLATARAAASQFAAAHFDRFAALAEKEAQLNDHGMFKEYNFIWQARAGQAWLPTFVAVTLNPVTAAVSSYSEQDVPVRISTTATITEQQARAAALSAAHLAGNISVDTEDLEVILEQGGQQKLAWQFGLSVVHTGVYHGVAPGEHVVQVDALTGVAIEVAK